MLTTTTGSAGSLALSLPAGVRRAIEETSTFVRAEPVAAEKPDPRIQAELDKFQQAQEKLRMEYIPKMMDLAAEKAVPGGLKELKARREKAATAFDALETATGEKWPLAIEEKIKALGKGYQTVKDLFDATGGKAITDKEVIEAFKKAIADATGIAADDIKIPPSGLTPEMARGLTVMSKTKLYNLSEWNGFEFKAASVCGWLGDMGDDVEYSKEIPDNVKEILKKDPNLKEKRDKAIKEARDEFGGKLGAFNGINDQIEKYKNVKGVFDAYCVFAQAQDNLMRADRQVQASLNLNAKDWVEGDSYPEFKAMQKEFLTKRGKAFDDAKAKIAVIQETIRKEEAEKRIK